MDAEFAAAEILVGRPGEMLPQAISIPKHHYCCYRPSHSGGFSFTRIYNADSQHATLWADTDDGIRMFIGQHFVETFLKSTNTLYLMRNDIASWEDECFTPLVKLFHPVFRTWRYKRILAANPVSDACTDDADDSG